MISSKHGFQYENYNDSGESWNVKKEYTIRTKSDLEKLLRFTKRYDETPGKYNLQSHNCTTVAVLAGKAAGQDVPSGYGKYSSILGYTFKGANPGDLGEDLMLDGGERK